MKIDMHASSPWLHAIQYSLAFSIQES